MRLNKETQLKVNIIARMEFELAYYYSTVHHFNHEDTPLIIVFVHRCFKYCYVIPIFNLGPHIQRV